MKINNQQLIGIPVVTQSGNKLGDVEGFNVDIESQSILEYKIRPSNLVKELMVGDFIIPRGQVVDITPKKIIVGDNFSKSKSFKNFKNLAKNRKGSVVIN